MPEFAARNSWRDSSVPPISCWVRHAWPPPGSVRIFRASPICHLTLIVSASGRHLRKQMQRESRTAGTPPRNPSRFVARRSLIPRPATCGVLGAFAGELRRTRSVVVVGHVGVGAAHRRCGIGTRLLAAAESWARDRHAHRLELRVDEANAAAIALYRRRGFGVEGRIADAVWLNGRWHAHHLMGLRLLDRTKPRHEVVALPRPIVRCHDHEITFLSSVPALWRLALRTSKPRT